MPDPAPLHGLDHFADRIRGALAPALGVAAEELQLERPRDDAHGDFAVPCFRFAKAAGCSPPELAQRLADGFDVADVSAETAGPFLNFRVAPAALAARVLQDAVAPGYGAQREGLTTIVEFSSPNIAKPMHVGHLRTTVIGAALARLFDRLGHRVLRMNHLGDWGSQFGKLVAAWQRWGSDEALEQDPIGHLLDLYQRYHREEDADPSLQDEAKAAFRALESGEENAVRATWRRFTELSLREFDRIYERFGITFDYVRGESWYEDKLPALLAWLDDRGVTEVSDGATIVDLESEGIQTPCLVKTAHGTTLYATRDLAAAKSRWEEFAFDQALYVVGAEQSLHFQQFKAVLRRCGADWESRIEHIPFGLVRLAEGKMSTREGRVIGLKELLDTAVARAREAVEEKNPEMPDKDAVAERVGVGAVIFHDLKHQRQRDVVFDWKEVLSFEGDTGPYLQYTHARCCSILRKAGRPLADPAAVDAALLDGAHDLFVALGRVPQAIREAAAKREPMLLAHALLKVGQAGNSFYREQRVLGTGDPALEDARLAAVDALRAVLADGLALLGVPAPEEM